MSETLKLMANVPETIALKFSEGLSVNSRYGGDQVMFTLSNDQKLYVAPIVASKIAEAGIRAGEFFSLCKRDIHVDKNRRIVEYEVQRLATVAAPAPAPSNSIHVVPAPAAPAAASAAHVVPASLAPVSNGAAMKCAGIAAIDAVLEIEDYARSRGMTDFAFGADNIQAIMCTLFINAQKGGRA